MQKMLPLWFFLLCLLLGALLTVSFGWFVRKTMLGATSHERLGQAALAVASFPSLVKASLKAIEADPDVRVRVPRTGEDLSGFHPIKVRPGIPLEGLMVRADPAALGRAPGWRILIGGFTLDGTLQNAALALSPQLEVVKLWRLDEKDIPGTEPKSAYGKFIHGVAILDDGSIVFGFDYGVALQRFDACGRRIWAVPGKFDHAVSLDDSERFLWTLEDSKELVKLATANGAIVKRISMPDIVAANPTIDILGVREQDFDRGNDNSPQIADQWQDDPFHLNDVEPLPAAIAAAFKGFHAGDLLVSARSLNLVFVLDPQTLKVRWWHSGSWRRQHDADWQPNGEITVFDNRMNRAYSRIVSIVPGAPDVRVVFDGRANDFYSRIRGKHQVTAAGTLLITSPQQGRVFEVERDGHVVFEMLNLRPGRGEFNYPLSEAIWLPSDTPVFKEGVPCDNHYLSSVSR
jgi:arylsulfotransferase ASST